MHDSDREASGASLRAAADALRLLVIDVADAARVGLPGTAVRMAGVAAVLWQHHLRHNPADPQWGNRDRFVLACEHAEVMLDALQHLSGYDVTLDEVRGLRRRAGPPPGHPPVAQMPGIATTTGPVGRGLMDAVGIALAERMAAGRFNRSDLDVVDHRTYAMVDGACLREDASRDAGTLAADCRLAKLTVLSDDTGIPLDGATARWYRDDTVARFRAYGWNVIGPVDSDAPGAIDRAIRLSHASRDRPTLIICRTRPVHTASGPRAMREALGWPHGPFEIPVRIRARWNTRGSGALAQAEWQALFDVWSARYPDDALALSRWMRGEHPADATAAGRRTDPAPHRRPLGPVREVAPPGRPTRRDDRTGTPRGAEPTHRYAGGAASNIVAMPGIA